jgi:hypothetical protein
MRGSGFEFFHPTLEFIGFIPCSNHLAAYAGDLSDLSPRRPRIVGPMFGSLSKDPLIVDAISWL